MVAERYGISEQTVWKWRKRDSVHDRSHTAHRLQSTLTPAQEAVAVSLRKTLLLPLDDLLCVVREFLNPNVSRSGLDRCLRRHGVGNLRDLKPTARRPAHKPFKAYEPGYLHVDVKYLPQMADEDRRRYLFVAIDRATRWVFVRVYPAKTAANARRFLRDLERAAPMRITRVLTDNGKEFTDRLFGLRKRAATGNHEFDRLCADLGIEHRLAPPMRPQTNGMVELLGQFGRRPLSLDDGKRHLRLEGRAMIPAWSSRHGLSSLLGIMPILRGSSTYSPCSDFPSHLCLTMPLGGWKFTRRLRRLKISTTSETLPPSVREVVARSCTESVF